MTFRARLSLFALESRETPSGPAPVDPVPAPTPIEDPAPPPAQTQPEPPPPQENDLYNQPFLP